jgi:hypothetical protein
MVKAKWLTIRKPDKFVGFSTGRKARPFYFKEKTFFD